jgi:hypothetical protein
VAATRAFASSRPCLQGEILDRAGLTTLDPEGKRRRRCRNARAQCRYAPHIRMKRLGRRAEVLDQRCHSAVECTAECSTGGARLSTRWPARTASLSPSSGFRCGNNPRFVRLRDSKQKNRRHFVRPSGSLCPDHQWDFDIFRRHRCAASGPCHGTAASNSLSTPSPTQPTQTLCLRIPHGPKLYNEQRCNCEAHDRGCRAGRRCVPLLLACRMCSGRCSCLIVDTGRGWGLGRGIECKFPQPGSDPRKGPGHLLVSGRSCPSAWAQVTQLCSVAPAQQAPTDAADAAPAGRNEASG